MQSHTQGTQENVSDNLVFGHVKNFIAQGEIAHLPIVSSFEFLRSLTLHF